MHWAQDTTSNTKMGRTRVDARSSCAIATIKNSKNSVIFRTLFNHGNLDLWTRKVLMNIQCPIWSRRVAFMTQKPKPWHSAKQKSTWNSSLPSQIWIVIPTFFRNSIYLYLNVWFCWRESEFCANTKRSDRKNAYGGVNGMKNVSPGNGKSKEDESKESREEENAKKSTDLSDFYLYQIQSNILL